jgi:hypothetical protein
MKKLLLGILIPVVILGGGAATVYFLLKDNSTPSYQMTSKTTETIMNEKLLMAFQSTKEAHKISYEFSQDDFNQVIALAYEQNDSNIKKCLRGVEMKIDGNTYHIYVYATVGILDTKLDLSCTFTSDEENYYLNIDSIRIGKLSKLKQWGLSILKSIMSEEKLNSAFSVDGIQMKADLGNERFVYSKKDCQSDLVSLLEKQTGEKTLMKSVISNFINMNLLSLDFTSKVQAVIDLEPLNWNDTYCNSANMLSSDSLNLDTKKNQVKTLLEEGKIDLDNSHPNMVFSFLARGYSSLDDDSKAYIDSIDMSSIGFKDALSKKSYVGYQPSSVDIRNEVIGSATGGTLFSNDGFHLGEGEINLYLQSQGILGYGYLLAGKVDDSYVLNYITLNNAYVDFINKGEDSYMNMVVGLSVNGYETSLILENKKTGNLDYGITLKNENIYFGCKEIDSDLKDQLYTLIKDNLPSDGFLRFDGNGNFQLNFESYLKDSISLIESTTSKKFTLDTSISGTSLTDENAGLILKGVLA